MTDARALSVLGMALVLVGPTAGAAQTIDVELRAGVAVGNYSETGAGLDFAPAPSFSVEAQLALRPSISAYAGFARSSFGCDEGFCTDRDVTLTGQGLMAGVRLARGLPWARAGLAWQSLRLEATDASESGDSGIGLELGGGIQLSIGSLALRPGLIYRRVPSNLDADDGHYASLSFEIGLAGRIPGLGS